YYVQLSGTNGIQSTGITVAGTLAEGQRLRFALPVVELFGEGPPVAGADSVSTPMDMPISIPLLANDFSPSGSLRPDRLVITPPPPHGTALFDPATGILTYTPGPGYVGGDELQYTIGDGSGGISNEATVTVAVNGGDRILTPGP